MQWVTCGMAIRTHRATHVQPVLKALLVEHMATAVVRFHGHLTLIRWIRPEQHPINADGADADDGATYKVNDHRLVDDEDLFVVEVIFIHVDFMLQNIKDSTVASAKYCSVHLSLLSRLNASILCETSSDV